MGSELPAILTHDDHARGCQGREYACTCGYDDRVAAYLSAQEEQIERLRGLLADILNAHASYVEHNPHALDNPDWLDDTCNAARAALEGSKRDG